MDNIKLRKNTNKKIEIGKIALNFHCGYCKGMRTFISENHVYCVGVDNNKISIDANLTCTTCEKNIESWFLLKSRNEIYSIVPEVRIVTRSLRIPEEVKLQNKYTDKIENFLLKSKLSYDQGLGIASITYLRIIFEEIIKEIAIEKSVISNIRERKSFKKILEEVNDLTNIIPKEFFNRGYKLYSLLSEVIHGNITDNEVLDKYYDYKKLVESILDSAISNKELNVIVERLNLSEDS